ncbi:TRAP-T-associated universal stress protein TeaD [Baekduia alba]|nr:TRAP-T-associated universal stress protein TeaD [Baekduia alba]
MVAFDGSRPARAAVERAVALFPEHRLIIATAWEPGLALAIMPIADTTGFNYSSPSVDQIRMVDDAQHDHASAIAEAGAALARELGAVAEADATREELKAADALVALAERTDAAAIVIGSRGHGGAKARLLGSTSRRVLHLAHRPVLVVREATRRLDPQPPPRER